ncbi:MAG: glycosyltransferase family 39 protein [Flavobacteriales bacterium]|nr:glycosyltransferase family 39 protein [Flavobacteriales bacterium]
MANELSPTRRKRHGSNGPSNWWSELRKLRSRTGASHGRFVLLVLVIGALFRIYAMKGAVTEDEATGYVNYVSQGFAEIFTSPPTAGHHLLYAFFARISCLIFGVHEWSLRLPALIAGIFLLPLLYLFTRLVFNRHIAVIALCLAAVSGPMVELSALAYGYTLGWCCMLAALLAARHFVKHESPQAAFWMAAFSALAVWSSPSMVYAAGMTYLWTLMLLAAAYKTTLRRRTVGWAISAATTLFLLVLFYLPVIMRHGLDPLLHPPSSEDRSWAGFVNVQQDRAFDLWIYFTATAPTMLAAISAISVGYAAYTSTKYRFLLFSLILCTVPFVLIQRTVAPPQDWAFVLPVLHIGNAIGIFLLLKLVRDKLWPTLSEPKRTLITGTAVLAVFGTTCALGRPEAMGRYPEARNAAEWIAVNARPGDRVAVADPWQTPVAFQLACLKVPPVVLGPGKPEADGNCFVLVSASNGQTPTSVLEDAELQRTATGFEPMLQWQRLELFRCSR